jgi:hypothetical protein
MPKYAPIKELELKIQELDKTKNYPNFAVSLTNRSVY